MNRSEPPRVREKKHRLPIEAYQGEVIAAFTLCLKDKNPAFEQSEVARALVEMLRQACDEHQCVALVYCFMPDHLHVILRGQSAEANLWRAVVQFKQRSGFWLAQEQGCRWQKDFYDHVMRKDEDVKAQIRYVVDNPVRKGLVGRWDEHPYTGAIGVDLKTILADV